MAKNLTIQDETVYNEQMNWLERILVRWHSLTRMEMRWRSRIFSQEATFSIENNY